MHIRCKSFEFIFLIEIIPALKKRRIRDSKVFDCSTKGDTAGRWISPLRLVTGKPWSWHGHSLGDPADIPEPGVKLGTACDRNKDDPSVRAINIKVVLRDESQDVWIDVNTEREIKSHGLSWIAFYFWDQKELKPAKKKRVKDENIVGNNHTNLSHYTWKKRRGPVSKLAVLLWNFYARIDKKELKPAIKNAIKVMRS
jgi:hypothetical protein